MPRQEFPEKIRDIIVERSRDEKGRICCEGCGLVLGKKPYEIDHILEEGLRSEADRKRKLTPADGQLLGTDCCHKAKTKARVKMMRKADRQRKRDNGAKLPKQTISNRGFPKSQKAKAVGHSLDPLPRRNPYTGEIYG